ncbi:hypothetical protein EDB84DRAFT_1658445 [Lactarius hengduanensis]|nr:hypothetical protein EDB84DRAFT_1658445 [Lactarius hengduanensis]
MAQYLGYEGTSSQPSPTRTVRATCCPAHTPTTLCGTRSSASTNGAALSTECWPFFGATRVFRLGATCTPRRQHGPAPPTSAPSSSARLSRYLELEPARAHRVDVEELVDEGVFSSCGSLDASSVETCSVEVRDGVSRAWVRERLVLYEGSEAVRAVGAWIKEQEELAPEGRRWSQDLTLGFDFPREYEEDDLGLGLDVRKVAALVRVTGHRVPPTSSSRKRRLGDGYGLR